MIEIISLSLTVICGFATLIWNISKTKEDIQKLIDRNHNSVMNQISEIRHDLDKMQIRNDNEHEKFVYRDHSLNESLNHKVQRIESWIDQICQALDRLDGFVLNRTLVRSRGNSHTDT